MFVPGFIIDFVSGPVSSGFTSAVALIIVTSQVKDILAIKVTGSTFVEQWISIFSEIKYVSVWDTVLGISCICVLLIMRVGQTKSAFHLELELTNLCYLLQIIATIKIGPTESLDEKVPNDEKPRLIHKIVNNTLWIFGTSRNAILVVLTACIGYSFYLNGEPPFKLIGDIPAGLPAFKPPPFGFINDEEKSVTFLEMLSEIGTGILVVGLIGLLENIAICKAFGKFTEPAN